jgi:antitoxin VapB
MAQIAKIFTNGRSQAVRLPANMRFEGKEVYIRQDKATGDVILSRKPTDWDSFFEAVTGMEVPSSFLDRAERSHGHQDRDPFETWSE